LPADEQARSGQGLLQLPERVGLPDSRRRGAYRIVYRILTGDHVVRVVRIEHRADVYRTR